MDNLIDRGRNVLTHALVIHADIVVRRAQGVHVEDVNGKRYMDFSSGLAVTNTGHNHPEVVAAIKNQADLLVHAGCIFYYEPLVLLPEALGRITPPGLDMFFFGNSGAEAVEGAIKLARSHTRRQGIVAFTSGFHGRTFGAMSLTTSNVKYRRNYHPLLPSVYHSPYPYCYRCFFGQRPLTCGMDCYAYLERLLKHLIPPEEVACMIIEPVLGEGGYVVPPSDFLRRLREFCDKWGIMLIFDEVQSGMGRTARWFASEHSGVVPDIMTLAKGIASGMPLSAIASTKEIMGEWSPASHGTTFGGNPLSCAAALATIGVIEKEKLLENARLVGTHALERLADMKERFPSIGDVRGLGFMIGIEFVKGLEPDTEVIRKVLARCLEKGLILIDCGVDKNIIRFAPPLITTREEIDRGLDIIEDAVASVVI
jgi:4-aminobutyrate aminotransferase